MPSFEASKARRRATAAKAIVEKITADIGERAGIGDAFYAIDEDTQNEMLCMWCEIILKELADL